MSNPQVTALRTQVANWRQRMSALAATTGQGTEAVQAANNLEFNRLSILVDNTLRDIALLLNEDRLSAEETLLMGALHQIPVDTPRTLIEAHLETLVRVWHGIAEPQAPAAPAPAPAPVLTPPDELSDEEAQWYLSQLTGEFAGATPPWPATIEGAKRHWRLHGKRQGRKWRADAPPPAWGPQAEFAPPGTQF